MSINKDDIQKAKEILDKANVICLFSHINPDYDGLCSQLVLAEYLKSLNKTVHLIQEETLDPRFNFIEGIDLFKTADEIDAINYDVAIVLDCGELCRVGKSEKLINKSQPIINIDHHVTNESFGTLNIVDSKASSTTELLYEIFLFWDVEITKIIAKLIYIGIVTDTGSFCYSNTTAKTHDIVSHLLMLKVHPNEIHNKIYASVDLDDYQRFLGIQSKIEVLFDGKIICVELKEEELSKFSKRFDIKESLLNSMRVVKDIEIILIFSEMDRDKTKVNFRSKGHIDVAKIAELFNGGGHAKASGCVICKDIRSAREDVLNTLAKVA